MSDGNATPSASIQPSQPDAPAPHQRPDQVDDVLTGERSDAGVPLSRWCWLLGLATLGGGIDLWTKQVMFDWRGLPGQQDIYWVIEGYFGIQTAVNIGAVFGMGAGKGWLFAILSVFAAVGIFVWLFVFKAATSKWLTVAMGLVLGGIIGNLYDRLGIWWQPGYPDPWRTGVRDWILWQASDQWRWPNFNIADSLLVTGAIMLIWHSFWYAPVPADENDNALANNTATS